VLGRSAGTECVRHAQLRAGMLGQPRVNLGSKSIEVVKSGDARDAKDARDAEVIRLYGGLSGRCETRDFVVCDARKEWDGFEFSKRRACY
jgi:hypothetical protein